MKCPRCDLGLKTSPILEGLTYICPSCGGCSLTLALARKILSQNVGRQFWDLSRTLPSSEVRCPSCSSICNETPIQVSNGEVKVDVCPNCQNVWFDSGELLKVGYVKSKQDGTLSSRDPELAPELRKELALSEIKSAKEIYSTRIGIDPPQSSFSWIMGAFGLPIECNIPPVSKLPWATWSIVIIFWAIFLLSHFFQPQIILEYGIMPGNPFQNGGINLIAATFLHAGLAHLLVDSIFLVLFADNVEDRIGSSKFLLLFAASAMAGNLMHAALDPQTELPVVGASSAISGVLVAYAMLFPKGRLQFYSLNYLRWFVFTVRTALALWILSQLMLGFLQLDGVSPVSGLAHVAAVVTGFAAWWLFLRPQTFRALSEK